MAVTDKPADATITTGAASNPASTKGAMSAAAAAKNKQNQKKKNPPNASKKKQQVVKSKFECLASGKSYKANGNLAGQFRVYQNNLAGSSADDKAYGLDS